MSKNKIRNLSELTDLIGDESDLEPISLECYGEVIAEYKLEQESISCHCLEGRSVVCNQKHQHGYIVRLKNNKYSVIGNSCIKKFGSETQIRQDINFYKNRQNRLKKIERLAEYVNNSESYKGKVNSIRSQLQEYKCMYDDFLSEMGEEMERLLNCSSNVRAYVRKEAKYAKDDKDKKGIENDFINIETLKGLESVRSINNYQMLEGMIKSFDRGMINATSLYNRISEEDYEPRERDIRAYLHQLDQIKDMQSKLSEINEDWLDFKNNNPQVIVFAYNNPYKLLRYIMGIDKLAAKKFCAETKNKYKTEYKLISIGYK